MTHLTSQASQASILFIGGGNMTTAILSGLIAQKYPASLLFVLDRNPDKLKNLQQHYQINPISTLEQIASLPTPEIIILSIKPQDSEKVCLELNSIFSLSKPLIISVMAGITVQKLERWFGEQSPIIRAMPNTPSKIQLGATGLFKNSQVNLTQQALTETIFSATGQWAWLDQEDQIDAIIALSGSGPAYFFYLIELMEKTAIELGLPGELAKNFAIQTAYGAGQLAHEYQDIPISQLRAQVTSKGGTTAAAIHTFEQGGLPLLVSQAMRAAKIRARELSG